MAYLIHSPSVAIRKLDVLSGTEDAELGSMALTPEGGRYVLTAIGWVSVDSDTLPDGAKVTVESGDGLVSLEITIADGVATIPDGYTLAEDA
ncbi:hypothetical protein [Allopusillimonas ginsengisoli]|uniref:hypothetical protein n=1 Tax=Allopusillimonas ginsengisoli TaxID=453575 RepID=UPI00101F7165|nr:hypothetical protein [Allopusillimonas ginsengisoli]TEA78647.1 hypothetical protein ERE07_09635 [Allopusillimonas ginsengisoli]